MNWGNGLLTRAQAVDQIRSTGVRHGDVVMVHSALRSLGPVAGGADTIIDAFLDAVGPEGTVLFPTFNFNAWTEHHYWDVDETPSEMGAMSEVARARRGARRTPHPIYSFAALGARADEFAACEDIEAYGDNSVFALFHRLDGLIVSLGLFFNTTFSLHHYVERVVGCDYRRTKVFGGIYLGADRTPTVKAYTMFVRLGAHVKTWIVPGMDELHARGVIEEATLGNAAVHYCRASRFFDEMSVIIRERPEMLHEMVSRHGGR